MASQKHALVFSTPHVEGTTTYAYAHDDNSKRLFVIYKRDKDNAWSTGCLDWDMASVGNRVIFLSHDYSSFKTSTAARRHCERLTHDEDAFKDEIAAYHKARTNILYCGSPSGLPV